MVLPAGALARWEAPSHASPPAEGVALTTMTDQSGNAVSPAQGAGASKGVWRVDGWAPGVPALEFDGIDDRYQFTSGSGALAFFQNKPGGTMVVAARDLGDPAGTLDRPFIYFSRNVAAGTGSSASRFTSVVDGLTMTFSSAIRRLDLDSEETADSRQSTSPNLNRLYVCSYDAVNGVATTRVDGVASQVSTIVSTGNFESTQPTTTAYIGANAAVSRHGKMMLAAWALYDRALSPADMSLVDAHFTAAPYNLTTFGPPNVTVTPSGSTNNVSWTAVTGATSYDVERDGVPFASGVTGLTVSDPGQTVGTTRTYRVRPRKLMP